MAYDPIRFAREMLAVHKRSELLGCACRAVAGVSGQPAYGVHRLPRHTWEQATVLSAETGATALAGPARSALFAVYRRLSLRPGSLTLEREPGCEPIFQGLLPQGPTVLDAVPLRSAGGQLIGALITGRGAADAAEYPPELEDIAALTAPALDAAWRHALARRDQERLQLLSETADDTLWDWNLASNELWWGGGLDKLFGHRTFALATPDWRRSCIHRDDADRVVVAFQTALAGTTSSWSDEYRLHGVNDVIIHVRERVYFLREVDGHAYRAMGTLQDISALQQLLMREKEARAEAERASAVKDDFLAMLGHELRNPLAPIVTVVEVLKRRTSVPSRELDILRRQAQHLVRLVDDLLDVSRIVSGKVDLTRQRTQAEPLITRAVEMAQPLITQRQHQLELDIAKDLQLEVDGPRIAQVLSNLLTNAAKFTEPGGHLRLSAREESGQAVFSVRDDGIGIAPDFLTHVFDRFSQAKQASNRAQGGLGLGLNIVKSMVQLHGGTVEAHSAGAGCGSEFIVKLPLPGPEVPQVPPLSETQRAPAARDVLIVDDNEDAAVILGALLAQSGHRVRVAHHPMEALSLFHERCPDVALVDIGLPTMDGYELARRMRSQPQGGHTKLIALTGFGQESDKARAAEAQFDAHVVKPALPDQIEQLISELTS